MSGYFMLPAKPFPVPVIRAVLLLGCLCFPLRNVYRVLSKERFQPENDPETDDREDRNNSCHSKASQNQIGLRYAMVQTNKPQLAALRVQAALQEYLVQ